MYGALFDILIFFFKLVCFNVYNTIYSFVSQFPLYCYWYCYNLQKSSGGDLQKVRCSKFRKIHKKIPALESRF